MVQKVRIKENDWNKTDTNYYKLIIIIIMNGGDTLKKTSITINEVKHIIFIYILPQVQ